jgi:hypothetical protein
MIKGHGGKIKLGFTLPGEDERFFIPGGILFLKTTLGKLLNSTD